MFLDELRNERRLGDLYFRNLQSDSFDLVQELMKRKAIDGESIELTRFQTYLCRPYLSLNHAIFLEEMNDRIEEIRETGMEPKKKREEIPKNKRLAVVKNRMPDFDTIALKPRQNSAMLRCAATAIAVELHRRRHSQWPDSLHQIDRDLLPIIPIDPFTNEPIQMERLTEGPMIFCGGMDLPPYFGSFPIPVVNLFDISERRKPCHVDLEFLPLPKELKNEDTNQNR